MLHCTKIGVRLRAILNYLIPVGVTVMTPELMNQMIENGKAAFEPVVKLNAISKEAVETLSKQQVDLARDYMDMGMKSVETLTSAKDPSTLMEAQVELAKSFGDKVMAQAEAYAKLAAATQEKVASWAEETMKTNAAQVEEAVKTGAGSFQQAVKAAA